MKTPSKAPQRKSGQIQPSLSEDVIKQKQKAEQHELAGRHKNTGAKDHKGAR